MKFSWLQKFNEQSREFRQDPFVVWSFRICTATLILCGIIIVLAWSRLPPVIPLFYSLPWGEEQLVHPVSFVLLLIGAIFMYCVNTLLAFVLQSRISYLSHIVLSATIALIVLLAYTVINLVLLVT